MVAKPVQITDLDVVNGLFTAEIDFGAGAINREAAWLEVAVGPPGESLTTLSPRQPRTATPYALQTRGLFVDEDLNVGIGTDMPEGVLDVRAPNGGDIHLSDPRGILRRGQAPAPHNLALDRCEV